MTPQDKAKQIRGSFFDVTKTFHPENGWEIDNDSAQKAAIIAVNYIIEWTDSEYQPYWKEVRTELHKL